MRKRKAGKIIRNIIIVIVLVAVVIGVYLYIQQQNMAKTLSETPNYRFEQVAKGDVDIGVTAKGSITSQKTTTVVLDWSGKVKSAPYEVGDIVQEGDVLAVVEDDNLSSNIDAANNSLKQQEINLQKQIDALEKTIDAPESGRIKVIRAKLDEDISTTVQTFGQLCYLSPDGKMELTTELDYECEVGDTFDVEDINYNRYYAIVTAVTKGTAGTKSKVTMDIEGDLGLEPDDTVWVYYRGQTEDYIGKGEVTIKNAIKVTGTGKITDILVRDNQYVTRGETLFVLDTKDANLTYESQTISVADAKRKVADLRKDQGKSELLSPVSGVLTEMNLLEGQNANSGQTVARIQDNENLQTVINVDELDIANIEIGQKVDITLEALEGQTFTGTVSKIAVVGTNTNNFATYPVTITIDDPGIIKIGMSCEATIRIESVKNVNILPVEMLQRGRDGYSVLLVTGGLEPGAVQERAEENASTASSTTAMQRMQQMQNAMTGARTSPGSALSLGVQTELRSVEVGLINEDYAQILSGLEEGDWVAAESKDANFMGMMMGGMGGGNAVVIEGGPVGSAPSR